MSQIKGTPFIEYYENCYRIFTLKKKFDKMMATLQMNKYDTFVP